MSLVKNNLDCYNQLCCNHTFVTNEKVKYDLVTRTSMVKRRVMEQTMPAEETGTASRNTHEYKNHGNGSLESGKKIFLWLQKVFYDKTNCERLGIAEIIDIGRNCCVNGS